MPRSRYRYSRLAELESKRAKKTAFIYIILTLALIILIFLYGIGFLSNFADFVSNLAGSSKPIEIFDKTPPAPPKINSYNKFTNKPKFELSGSAEPSATVTINFNNEDYEQVVDSEGNFSQNFTLKQGTNKFYLFALDKSGNKSSETENYEIIYDNKPPDLSIEKPKSGESFYGSLQKQLTIEGQTESESKVTINDRVVIVGSSGKFSQNITLNDGTNDFAIKSTDAAGNETEVKLSVNFSP